MNNKNSTGLQWWQIPVKLARDLGLTEGQVVEVKCGSLSTQAAVKTSPKKSVDLSNDMRRHLKIPMNTKLDVKPDVNGSFRLGPVIGILTFPRVLAKRDFHRYIPYALRMKNKGLLYVFGPKSINPKLRTIRGYYYLESQGAWLEREFPFPDGVIDRIYPNSRNAQRKLEVVIGPNKIFNKTNLINKIRFFKALNKDVYLQCHVPETRLFRQVSDFEYMLSKYPGIFLKPVKGMKGKGIIQVRKSAGSFVCRYMSENGPETLIINKSDDIFGVIKRAAKGKKSYIIQAEILRMTYQNRPFNFRVMAVKDGRDHWLIPAIFSKIADSTGFLTNNSSGGHIIFLKDLLNGIEDKLPYSKNRFLNLLTKLSINTASILDEKFGPLGKLGLDIVIDSAGKPWLIEANGNPGLLPRAALAEYPYWRTQMYDYPLAYCLFLSGFGH